MKKARAADLERRVTQLENQMALVAWLHAERDYYLLQGFTQLGEGIKTIAWLHAERDHQLQHFIASEERLIRRARAVKAAKTMHAKQQGVMLP